MASPIDYSKWDAFCEEESETENLCTNTECRFTQLHRPAQISIGPEGVSVKETLPSNPFSKSCAAREDEDNMTMGSRAATDADIDSKLTSNGGMESNSHCWSQTESTVSISFFLPSETKAKDNISFAINDIECVRSGASLVRPRLKFSYKKNNGEEVAVNKDFYYPLSLDSDLLEGCWELQTVHGQRFITFQFFKESIMHGVFVWWDRCFCDDVARVDLETLKNRRGDKGQQFKQVWEEAHELFKQRIAKRKNIS